MRTTGSLAPFLVIATVILLSACQTPSSESPPTPTGTAMEPPATPDPASARATVDRFLEFYFSQYGSGLPNDAERAALGPMVTPAFGAALDAAARAERCHRARTGGTEPPLVQGDIFTSLFEKAARATGVSELADDGRTALFGIALEAREPGAAEAAVAWSDRVVLARVEGRWLIDDFIHDGDWQFTMRGSVKAMLEGVAKLCTGP
jgi:hypothetical protein